MAMEFHYELGEGMGVYLELDSMGEMSLQHVQNNATMKGEN